LRAFFAGVLLFAAALAPASAASLSVRFIGNEAFEIRDGRTTLLTDFPYRSGAFGYMTYPSSELAARPGSLCLFTHGHADHFAPSLLGRVGCAVFGPPDLLAKAPKAKVLPGTAPLRFEGVVIHPVPTSHGRVGHFSYLVVWRGLKLYFAGDTESTRELSSQGALDALFVSPWLVEAALKAHALPEAARVILYHRKAGEAAPSSCPKCLVPKQGEVIEIPIR
jgi:L-ascorbate metabolism protein UlaG (beta-lactamase superfamily)